jgi:hypothetical protein
VPSAIWPSVARTPGVARSIRAGRTGGIAGCVARTSRAARRMAHGAWRTEQRDPPSEQGQTEPAILDVHRSGTMHDCLLVPEAIHLAM